jgi:hypothetical protein
MLSDEMENKLKGETASKWDDRVGYSGDRNNIISLTHVKHYPTHQAVLARRYGGAHPQVGPKRLWTTF